MYVRLYNTEENCNKFKWKHIPPNRKKIPYNKHDKISSLLPEFHIHSKLSY